MSSLTPFQRRVILRGVRRAPMYMASPYIRRAQLAAWAIKNGGPTAYRAAKAASRLIRSRRRRSRNQNIGRHARKKIGEKPGADCKKNLGPAETNLALAERTLYETRINDIPKSDGTIDGSPVNSINGRQRDIIFYSGFKLCLEVRNNHGANPVYYNWAIVSPKGEKTADGFFDNTDFFRSSGQGDTRSLDFGNAFAGMEYNCLNINVDKFLVLYRGRQLLGTTSSQSTSYANGFRSSYYKLEKWFPIKRQLRFDTGGRIPVNGQLFLVQWCSKFMGDGGGANGSNMVDASWRLINYFHEPKRN